MTFSGREFVLNGVASIAASRAAASRFPSASFPPFLPRRPKPRAKFGGTIFAVGAATPSSGIGRYPVRLRTQGLVRNTWSNHSRLSAYHRVELVTMISKEILIVACVHSRRCRKPRRYGLVTELRMHTHRELMLLARTVAINACARIVTPNFGFTRSMYSFTDFRGG